MLKLSLLQFLSVNCAGDQCSIQERWIFKAVIYKPITGQGYWKNDKRISWFKSKD